MLVVVGVISFIYDGVFQIFYTSVIRRMKVGLTFLGEYSFTNWKNSILCLHQIRPVGNMGIWAVIVTFDFVWSVILVLVFTGSRRHLLGGILLALQIIVIGVILRPDVVQKQEIMKGIRQITESQI